MLKTYKWLLFLLILSFIAILPFFHAGFFPMHDDTQVARIHEMGKMLGNGVFPVRYVSGLGYGYGYPLFNFYAPFAYYLGGVLILVGINALLATKILMSFVVLLSGISMYLLARGFWGERGGFISGMLYLFAPFHAVNIYVRGDLAEFTAYAFIPLIFLGLWKTYTTRQWNYVLLGGVSYALVILSHNLTAMMISPFVFFVSVGLYLYGRTRAKSFSLFYLLSIPMIGILLAAFYWLPVFPEMQFTNVLSQVGGTANYADHFVCLPQLWSSPWGFGGSAPGCADGLSFRIGKVHWFLIGMSFFCFFFSFKKNKQRTYFLLSLFFGFIFSIYIMLDASRFLWTGIPHMVFFQYPWRFLTLTALFSSLIGGYVFWFISQQKTSFISSVITYVFISIICIVLIVTSMKIFIPQEYNKNNVTDYTSEKAIKWYASRLTDEYLPQRFIKPRQVQDIVTDRYQIYKGFAGLTETKETVNQLTFIATVPQAVEVLVRLAYFPTWHVYIDGKKEYFGVVNRGIIVSIPKGMHSVRIGYEQTFVELLANMVSLITFILLLIITSYTLRRKKYGK